MPEDGRQTPLQHSHDVKYVLVVTEGDERTSAVKAATCLFCLKFVREVKLGAKQKRRTHPQVFSVPVRTDNYARHYVSAPLEKWTTFLVLATNAQASLFSTAFNDASILLAHFDSHVALGLVFNRDIIEGVI